jgi:hypothetical protein
LEVRITRWRGFFGVVWTLGVAKPPNIGQTLRSFYAVPENLVPHFVPHFGVFLADSGGFRLPALPTLKHAKTPIKMGFL